MMRRGFKSEAEGIALEQRDEMGLGVTDRFDPFALAELLGIPVISFDDCARRLRESGHGSPTHLDLGDHVSAVTVFSGYRRLIVHNDRSVRVRQVSDLSHELSHTLLGHDPKTFSDPARYHRDGEIEDEAEYLGGALLIPRDGALALMRAGRSPRDVAAHYGVSDQMAQWRIRGTGVDKQIEREVRRQAPKRGTAS